MHLSQDSRDEIAEFALQYGFQASNIGVYIYNNKFNNMDVKKFKQV